MSYCANIKEYWINLGLERFHTQRKESIITTKSVLLNTFWLFWAKILVKEKKKRFSFGDKQILLTYL